MGAHGKEMTFWVDMEEGGGMNDLNDYFILTKEFLERKPDQKDAIDWMESTEC